MKVYLDNNILVDIEEGNLQFEDFLSKKKTSYCYSDAHMNELLEARGIQRVSQEGRLELLSNLCKRNYIISGFCAPEFWSMDPKEAYNQADNPIREVVNMVVSRGIDQSDYIRKLLGFESRDLNNVKPEQILGIIDTGMRDKLKIGLLEYLKQTEAFGRALFCTLLNLIDMANYWGDKRTNRSTLARYNDASHAYYAQICDILVTNDRRMRAKIQAIYSFIGIKTRVMSAIDYLNSY